MAESATLEEAPVSTSADPDPIARPIEGAEMPQGLRNLLDKVLPVDGPEEPISEAEPSANGSEPVEAKTTEKPPEEKKPEPKAPDPTSRLAPDVFTKTEEPAQPAAEIEMPEEPPAHIKTEKAREDYRKWRKTTLELHQEVARLKSEKPAAPVEDLTVVEELRKQNQNLLARIERVDLMASPKFQKEFLVPRGNMFAEAKEVLKDAGVDPETLDRVMALTGKAKIDALDSIISEIPSQMLRDRLGRLVDGIDAKTREINEQLKNARGTREQLTRQEKIEQHAQIVEMEQQMKTALQMTRRDLAENRKIELLYKTGRPEYKWFDDLVDSVDATAQEVMLRSTPQQLPVIAYYAALYEPTHDLLQAERKARIAAEDRLAAIEGVEPTLGEDKRLPKPAVDDDADIKTAVFAHLKSGRK